MYKQLLITLQIEDKMVYFHVIIYNIGLFKSAFTKSAKLIPPR
jgi:hypothetical protein